MLDLTRFFRFLTLASAFAVTLAAQAQSSCSSDGQPRPVALVERFISADCETCWKDPKASRARHNDIAIDWIVPGAKGDDAPLSAAATRDAQSRLEGLRRAAPPQAEVVRHPVTHGTGTLRVAHGLPFNGYIGSSIELRPRTAGPFQAWLVLVETIPAGSEGTVVARNLVRNALQVAWDAGAPASRKKRIRLFESRPLSIPEGADPTRLRVVGWAQDARGRVIAAAQTACIAR